MGPLDGLRIIDLTTVLMGPFATQLLGDLGADVIKVEAGRGDVSRQIPPFRNPGMSGTFIQTNRNKRSVCLDLKSGAAKDAFMALLETADVMISNVRPKALARLGLSAETLLERFPRLVVVNLVGFGQVGPYAALPAYDDLIQGMVGLPAMTLDEGAGRPIYTPVSIADRAVGIHAAMATLAAIYSRDRTGKGQAVEVPMFETMAQFILGDHMCGETFDPPSGEAGYKRILNPERRPFPTADGYICVLVYNDDHWSRFGDTIGRGDEFRSDPRLNSMTARVHHTAFVSSLVAAIMVTRTTDEWLVQLAGADVPAARMNTLANLIADPHLEATGYFEVSEHPTEGRLRQNRAPTAWSATPPGPLKPAPTLGQHTEDVLAELGLTQDQIRAAMGGTTY
jgi:crotonobetainyl-CoA:carnitine CoA-transferase CaiB-like acyl-CoA transferase